MVGGVRLAALVLAVVSACRGGTVAPPDAGAGDSSVLLDFSIGHVRPIQVVWRSGDRILSRDDSAHWVLWDVATRREIASGEHYAVALAGDAMIAQRVDAIEVRSLATGAISAS